MTTEIVSLTAQQVEVIQTQLVPIYRAAFAPPPYEQTEAEVRNFTQSLARHVRREGFRCCIAREEGDGRILGFMYGYTSLPGQWWYEQVARALTRSAIRMWLYGAFEVAEFAVLPSVQGQHIGSKLHDTLLADLPHQTAVLSTYQGETTGMHLYRKRGWVPLVQDFYFSGSNIPMMIMGLDLSVRGEWQKSNEEVRQG
jgi:ribosomal protein S18 acetylase RimI-like enzyme